MKFKELLIITILVFSFSHNVFSKIVKIEVAEKVALNFYYQKAFQFNQIENMNIKIKDVFVEENKNEPLYYIFNFDNDNGFVIVSADDITYPVFGYSFKGNYENENQPPAFQNWMNNYKEQIIFLRESKAEASNEIKKEWNKLMTNEKNKFVILNGTKSVSPLLTTEWDQGKYYNELCPLDIDGPGGRTYAGCVATAMAQVMNYFKFPEQGYGSYGYSTSYGYLSANFGTTTYKWNEMVNVINNKPNNAVATLMYHCGVSIDMNYSPSGSSANTYSVSSALKTYFKYSTSIQVKSRYSYSNSSWNTLLRNNIDNNRPLVYSGYPSGYGAGHAFVCDGYQGTSYFHFNWGWSGSYDGYYYTTNLNPGSYSFTNGQRAIINIQPGNGYPYYCNGIKTLTSVEGVFEDGSGNTDYLNDVDCYWLISPQEPVSSITLEFDRFETESNNDVVTVYDGTTSSSTILGTFSGTSLPTSVTSTGDKMLVKFSSNTNTVFSGWHASYKSTLPVYCNGIVSLIATSDSFSDGSGVNNYNDGTMCKWMIEPPNASSITLNFTKFDVEPNDDFIKIYDLNSSSGTLLAEYSGSSIPPSVTSSSGKMYILFYTNNSNNNDGWDATYSSNVGINENDFSKSISIYPNPAEDIINISFNSKENQDFIVEILSVSGKEVYSDAIKDSNGDLYLKNIDVSQLSQGVYILRILGETMIVNRKIIIQ